MTLALLTAMDTHTRVLLLKLMVVAMTTKLRYDSSDCVILRIIALQYM